MPEQTPEIMKGTTTVGIVFNGGVVLATEKRATMGYLVASKKAKKVYRIADRIGMPRQAVSGTPSSSPAS